LDGEKNISKFYIIIVEPKYSGNIGAIARAMANFDFDKLILVKPCRLDDECYQRAMHAKKILDNAKIFKTFDGAIENIDYLIATSSIETYNDKKHLRIASNLEDLSDKILGIGGNIGLIFGREDYGLFNEEIAKCDALLKIPTSDSYLSLNLSHAVAVVLYSIYIKKNTEQKKSVDIGKIEKEKLFDIFNDLLDIIDYPNHKKDKTNIMFRKMMGRAVPSKWEYHTLMGVFSQSMKKIKKRKN